MGDVLCICFHVVIGDGVIVELCVCCLLVVFSCGFVLQGFVCFSCIGLFGDGRVCCGLVSLVGLGILPSRLGGSARCWL